MFADLARKLGREMPEKRRWRLHMKADMSMTPLEMAILLGELDSLAPESQEWLKRRAAMAGFDCGAPEPYQRQRVYEDVELFADPVVPRAGKKLIIGFSSAGDRLLMPLPAVLQRLPSASCDVLVLRDPSRSHYLNGVPPADSFVGLIGLLHRVLPIADYTQVFCYGASMGGLAALRAGLLLGARRAISMCGMFPWHIKRLMAAESEIPAFDLLCACVPGMPVELCCVYGEDRDKDRTNAERIAAIRPVRLLALPGIAEHNVVMALLGTGGLDALYRDLFDL